VGCNAATDVQQTSSQGSGLSLVQHTFQSLIYVLTTASASTLQRPFLMMALQLSGQLSCDQHWLITCCFMVHMTFLHLTSGCCACMVQLMSQESLCLHAGQPLSLPQQRTS
jgi:hypothetical protein